MTALSLVVTRAGLERFTAAQLGEDIDLTVAEVGLTAADFVAAPTLTALPGEFRRLATVSGEAVGDDVVHLVVRDDVALTYEVRGFGLFLADGTLFAVYAHPGLLVQKAAPAVLHLAIDIAFPSDTAAALTFGDANFLNPPATTVAKGVVELATEAEADAGTPGPLAVTAALLRRGLEALRTFVRAELDDLAVAVGEAIDGLSARKILGAGLVTGGGTLAADRTLTVTAASPAEVRAATDPDRVVTPAALGGLPRNLAATGSMTLPTGVEFRWGRYVAAANGRTNVVFDTPFTTACFVVVGGGVFGTGADSKDNPPGVVVDTIGPAGFQAFSADDTAVQSTYFAIGH